MHPSQTPDLAENDRQQTACTAIWAMLFGQAINPCVVDWIRFVVRQLCTGCPDPLVFAFIVLWFIYPERRTDRKIPSQT